MLSFFIHIYELKLKLLYFCISVICTFITTYLCASKIITFITKPISFFIDTHSSYLISTNVFEVFNTYINLSLYAILFFNIPICIYLLITFLTPGLFKYEKTLLYTVYSLFLANLIFSIFFSFYLILPNILSFFLSLDITSDVKIQPKLYDYTNVVCQFMFIYAFVVFQVPSIVYILIFVRGIHPSFLYKKRRLFLVFFLITGCIFSSPDITCLILISMPLLFFFELAVFLSIIKNKYNSVHSRELLER